MRERDGMALGLAYLFGAGATLVVLTVVLPHGHGGSVPALLALAITAYGVTGLIALRGRRLPPTAYAVILTLGAVLVGGCAWWGGEGGRVYALMYLWVAMYGFYFFSARFGFGITLFSVATYAFILAERHISPVPWIDGLMVGGTAVVAGTFVGRLVLENRRRARDLDSAAHLAGAMSVVTDVDWVPNAICEAACNACEADVAVLLEGDRLRGSVGPDERVSIVEAGPEVAAARAGTSLEGAHGQRGAFIGRVPVLARPVVRDGILCGVLAVAWERPGRYLPESSESAVTLFAGVAAAIFEREERLSGERERRALEINDSVLQGLVVAKYALAGNRPDEVRRAVDETLIRARELMNRQLGRGVGRTEIKPGDLRREKPGLDI